MISLNPTGPGRRRAGELAEHDNDDAWGSRCRASDEIGRDTLGRESRVEGHGPNNGGCERRAADGQRGRDARPNNEWTGRKETRSPGQCTSVPSCTLGLRVHAGGEVPGRLWKVIIASGSGKGSKVPARVTEMVVGTRPCGIFPPFSA